MNKNVFDFKNKTAVITGGAQGFGLDIAKRFLDGGAKVVIWDIDTKLLEKVLNNINNDNLTSNIVDVSNYKTVEDAVNKTLKNRLIDLINMFVEDHNVIHSWDEKDILTLDKLIKNEVRGERQEIFGLDQKPGIDLYYYSKDPFSNSKEDNIWVPKDIKKKDLPSWNSRNIYFFETI